MIKRASDGDRLDLICWKHYGALNGRIVEQVLEANPGLCATETLTTGQTIVLPDIASETEEQSLW